ncbi:MAG: trehalose-phosphatase [Deltaproteobacteria bacterium RBG_13_61_14]|nr:MAG: trehalose-phosphatase [Deltaproteobacteria bacterium RBG_13_61_14]
MKPELNSPELARFWERLAGAPQRVLMLDYDGTLAPFRVERDHAFPYPGVREALDRILAGRTSRLVLVSGRWTKDLIPLLGLRELPEIWGCHGLERLFPDGRYEIAPMDERSVQALAEADHWAEAQGWGERCEAKPGSIALHWRGLAPAEQEALSRQFREAWAVRGPASGLELHDFDGGLELRAPGRNKGDAVETILAEAGPEAAAAYLGDDLTDEDAFGAIRGRGLSVLVREQWRETAAELWLRPPGELVEWLNQWARGCAGRV